MRDIAWAKLNLTLEVLGRREDGFHELRSLVAFAGVGDTLEFVPARLSGPKLVSETRPVSENTEVEDGLDRFTLAVEGPFAAALDGANLILNAAKAAHDLVPAIEGGHFRLVKTLPVAAGLGGGSADAAATLRLLVRASQGEISLNNARALAPMLGSDVAVCLESVPAMMTGRGEAVALVKGFPQAGVLLVNPGVALSTAAVYGALCAHQLSASPEPQPAPDFSGDFGALIDYASSRGNDLEASALTLAPIVGTVLSRLKELSGVRLVRLSGSGATCFAVFGTPREALRAAILVAEDEPEWWVTAGVLGDPNPPLRG